MKPSTSTIFLLISTSLTHAYYDSPYIRDAYASALINAINDYNSQNLYIRSDVDTYDLYARSIFDNDPYTELLTRSPDYDDDDDFLSPLLFRRYALFENAEQGPGVLKPKDKTDICTNYLPAAESKVDSATSSFGDREWNPYHGDGKSSSNRWRIGLQKDSKGRYLVRMTDDNQRGARVFGFQIVTSGSGGMSRVGAGNGGKAADAGRAPGGAADGTAAGGASAGGAGKPAAGGAGSAGSAGKPAAGGPGGAKGADPKLQPRGRTTPGGQPGTSGQGSNNPGPQPTPTDVLMGFKIKLCGNK